MPTPLERALIATRESRRIEFKEQFDLDEETVRDVAALANSGGGVILFGVDKSGAPTGAELPSVGEASKVWARPSSGARALPRAAAPTLEFGEAVKFGTRLLTAVVPEAATPLVCDGVVYVRRGARSVPATTEDLARIVQRRVDAARREWLGAVRRVVKAPEQPMAVRVVQDRRAPAYRVVD